MAEEGGASYLRTGDGTVSFLTSYKCKKADQIFIIGLILYVCVQVYLYPRFEPSQSTRRKQAPGHYLPPSRLYLLYLRVHFNTTSGKFYTDGTFWFQVEFVPSETTQEICFP